MYMMATDKTGIDECKIHCFSFLIASGAFSRRRRNNTFPQRLRILDVSEERKVCHRLAAVMVGEMKEIHIQGSHAKFGTSWSDS